MSGGWLMPREGEILADKYRVDSMLGQGGMGVVVAATHLQLDQKVAIKFLLPEATEHPEVVERFAREARAAARMQGRHVVRVLDVGTLDDGRTFMVMEHLEGEDLEHLLERGGAQPLHEVVAYVLEACEALGEAHAKGIVHRDLKPGNLFLARQPDGDTIVKVLDFGISKLQDDRVALTKTSTAMGTAFYMSPEQLTNAKNVDERADIWSLGVILYELVSNTRPYDGESMPEIIAKILRNKPAPLHELVASVPPPFDEVVGKCLASDREDRYVDVAALAQALAPFAGPQAQALVERIVRVRGRSNTAPQSRLPPSLALATPAEPRASTERRPGTGTQIAVSSPTPPVGIATASTKTSPRLVASVVAAVLLVGGAAAWLSRATRPAEVAPPAVAQPLPSAPTEVPAAKEPPPTVTATAASVAPSSPLVTPPSTSASASPAAAPPPPGRGKPANPSAGEKPVAPAARPSSTPNNPLEIDLK